MRDLIIVLTCPRFGRGPSYLRQTLVGLDSEGADDAAHKLIVSDGPFEEDLNASTFTPTVGGRPWEVISMPGPSGSLLAVWRVFEHALAAKYDRLLLCEDDIEPCRNALRRIFLTQVPEDVAFVAFFDMNDFDQQNLPPPGIHRIPPQGQKDMGFWGHQTTLIPRRTLEWFCAKLPVSQIAKTPPDKRGTSDATMGSLCEGSPWPRYGKHMPCLVEHVGDVSRIDANQYLRKASQYVGRNFNALNLPPFK